MRTVEQIVEQIRAAAGADFAFVLTRKGRLVTHRAPRDMPEEGRMRLVRAARPLVGTDKIIEVTMPREELVPFGGAAPVDVYVCVVAEQAIVCVAVATWAEKMRVAPAVDAGMRAIAPLLRRGLPSARRPADVEPAKGSPYVPERDVPASVPPPSGGPDSGPFVDLRASLIPEVPRAPRVASTPEITVGEAPLGRASLAAIRREEGAEITVGEAPLGRASLAAIRRDEGQPSLPEITVGEAPLGRASLAAIRRDEGQPSLPEITVGEAPLGRASLAAIEASAARARPRPASSPESLRVDLASLPDIEIADGGRATLPYVDTNEERPALDRVTLPWVESAADAKRAADAARVGRKLASPKVTIKLEDAPDIEAHEGKPTARRS